MDGEELVRDLVQRQTSEEVGELLRLDWVRNWNQSCQTAVLLSRLQHRGTALSPLCLRCSDSLFLTEGVGSFVVQS